MKIGKTPEQQQAAAVVADKARTAASPQATTAKAASDSSAKVALSNTAASLIGNTASSSADFDADKVASVTKSIDNGTYKISPHVIADKLIANARELLTKVSQ